MTTTQTDERPILIVGGRGKTGSRVADRLEQAGIAVRLGSRSSTPAFDWTDRSTWDAAISGTRAAYLTYFPDLATPGAAEAVGAFAEMALERSVKRLVLLSGRGEPEAQVAEAALLRSGAEATIIRAAWFAQNFSESLFAPSIVAGQVFFPADGVREPFIDADDLADVAVTALTQPGHAGKIYEITGPRLLTFAEAVQEIARATDRSIGYQPVPVDTYLAELKEAGLPGDLIAALELLLRENLDGRNESTTDVVEQVIGRKPRDFADFARDAAAQGMWEERK